MSFLKNLLGGESMLGVDMGTTSIKLAEITPDRSAQPSLKNYGLLETYGYLERFNDALQTSSLRLLESETAAYLNLLLEHAGARSKKAVVSIPHFSAFTTLIELPLMSESETSQAMEFQAKQYIPLPISAVTLDWLKVGERIDEQGNKKQQVLLISVPNEQIEKYQKIFALAGLKLMAVEIEGVSLARSLDPHDGKPTLIVDIGARSTSFSVAKDGKLKFAGQTDFAGGSLTQTLATGLGLSMKRAEDLKKSRGLTDAAGYELSTLILPIIDVIINETGRVKGNFESHYQEKIERVVLTGGGSNLAGLVDYFGQQIGLPTEKGNPFKNISYPDDIEPFIKDLGPKLAIAIGLGSRL